MKIFFSVVLTLYRLFIAVGFAFIGILGLKLTGPDTAVLSLLTFVLYGAVTIVNTAAMIYRPHLWTIVVDVLATTAMLGVLVAAFLLAEPGRSEIAYFVGYAGAIVINMLALLGLRAVKGTRALGLRA